MGNYYEERRIALENSAAVHNARLNELYGRSKVKPEDVDPVDAENERVDSEDEESEDERGGYAKCAKAKGGKGCPQHCEPQDKDAGCNESCSAHCPEDE